MPCKSVSTKMEARRTPRRRGRPKKKVKVEAEELVSYEDLQARVKVLEEQNQQLTHLLSSSPRLPALPPPPLAEMCRRGRRETIFTTRGARRQVALRVAYLGVENPARGVAEVEVQRWVEEVLLHALTQAALVDDPTACGLQRCGGGGDGEGWNPVDQVFSVTLRSRGLSSSGILPGPQEMPGIKQEPREEWEEEEEDRAEVMYPEIINQILPREVRVLAWVGMGPELPSSPLTYIYKYFFPRAHLDLQVMNEAGQAVVVRQEHYSHQDTLGSGNIHSLSVTPTCCPLLALDGSKPKCSRGSGGDSEDGGQWTESEVELNERTGRVRLKRGRRMVSGGIKSELHSDTESDLDDTGSESEVWGRRGHGHLIKQQSCKRILGRDGYEMCVATLSGQDLLPEEVLEVLGELFYVGEGQARPGITLTGSTGQRKCRPPLVSEVALRLSECRMPGSPTWHWDREALKAVITHLQPLWAMHAARAEAIRHSLWGLETALMETSLESPNMRGVEEEEEENGVELPRAQCEGLLQRKEGLQEVTPSFTRPATRLLIQLVGQQSSRLVDPMSWSDAFKEVQEEMDACGYTFSSQRIHARWRELLRWYSWVKEAREEGEGGDKEEEEEEYFELLEDILLASPQHSPPAVPESTIRIRTYALGGSPVTTGMEPSAPSPVVIKCQMGSQSAVATRTPKPSQSAVAIKTRPTVAIKCQTSSQPTVAIKCQTSSQPTVAIKTKATNQSIVAIKSQTSSQPTVAIKSQTSQPTVAIKSQTSSQPTVAIKTQCTSQPTVALKTQPTVAIKTQLNVAIKTQSKLAIKTQPPSQPIVAIKTQSTSQPTVTIRTKRVGLLQSVPQVAKKRPLPFVSPVSIKTRIVTQPRHSESKCLSASSPRITMKTQASSSVSVPTHTQTQLSTAPSVTIKTEPQTHVRPISIRTLTRPRPDPPAKADSQHEPFVIPEAAMTSVSQQKPNTTVLHHHGDSVFATQTSDGSSRDPKLDLAAAKPDMAQIFLEYLIQQGEQRAGQVEEEMVRAGGRQAEWEEGRRRREQTHDMSVRALRDIEFASADLKNSLLGV